MIRRACAAVFASLLAGNSAAQGRSVTGGLAWVLDDDWLVLGKRPTDEDSGFEESVRQALAARELASTNLTISRPELPEGIKDRHTLSEIRDFPDPIESSPIGVRLCIVRPRPKPPEENELEKSLVKKTSAPKETDIWSGETKLKTSTGRNVDAALKVTEVVLGAVVGDDTDQSRVNALYLCCHRVGVFKKNSSAVQSHDDKPLQHTLKVLRVRIASQGSDFEGYLSHPALHEKTKMRAEDLIGNGDVVKKVCESLFELPWFSGDDPEIPIWREPPETSGTTNQKLAIRCVQLLTSASGRTNNIKRAVLLAVVSEMNHVLSYRMQARNGAQKHRDPLPIKTQRILADLRNSIVEALKSFSLADLELTQTKGAPRHGIHGFAADLLEMIRQQTIDGLTRLASHREDSPQMQSPESDEFGVFRVVLGSTAEEDRLEKSIDERQGVSLLTRDVAAVLRRAEALTIQDKALKEKKLAAREQSAQLMMLRQSTMNKSEEERRLALEKRIKAEADYIQARRSRIAMKARLRQR